MAEALTIYFAGDLFDHKDLIGNALLAAHIESESGGRYKCILPQDLEQGSNRKENIRNQDLKMVIEADLGLFNFDGADLDSGTVVEFMLAKQLDIPSVILRTDFRNAGDQDAGDDKWNLMCSYYPRTEVITLNGMQWYQQKRKRADAIHDVVDVLYKDLAGQVITALDKARSAPRLTNNDAFIKQLYQWAVKFPGEGLKAYINDEGWVDKIIANKKRKGLI